jgi:uncharacterized membrane protein YgcG
MAPSFKQGNYFAGLRTGLNSLMVAANPESAPQGTKPQAAGSSELAAGTGAASAANSSLNSELPEASPPASEPYSPAAAAPEPQSSGLGMGTLAIGALGIGGVIWLLMKLFRRKTPPAAAPNVYSNQNPGPNPNQSPDFLGTQNAGNRPAGPAGNYNRGPAPQQAPDFLGNRSSNMGSGGMGVGGIGSGMGGILATGAAAAAGAYLGNRMASGGHDNQVGHNLNNPDNPASQTPDSTPYAAGIGGAASSGGFPALDGTGNTDETSPDYFSDLPDESAPDYFSADETSSYDDTSSDDTGGGGFDDDNSNSGSW